MRSTTRSRTRRALGAAALLALGLTGCAPLGVGEPISPWVVAHHDEKAEFHLGAGDALLNLDSTSGVSQLQEFQAVGYLHLEGTSVRLHMEYETSVSGESYVSRLITDQDGYSFDQSHEAGSSETYYLLGDALKEQASDGKSWVVMPVADLQRQSDPERNCQLFAVSYMCALIGAWNTTQDELDAVPVQLSRSESGSQHFSTAVSVTSLVAAGLGLDEGDLRGFDSETVVPMHLWVNADGLVNKIEVNGVVEGENGEQLSLQIGFEITSLEASGDMQPVSRSDIPRNDLYQITSEAQLEEFLSKL
ncbi:hypothetical protein [Gulosibacter sp. 10]|uniref:hypothetical protein n=1 Tax=Gulosibacter sp. 10 TaxID=1255570 RepID=UPI000B34C0C1|nr:hypothetical protein [Gulosibacter sp. 10]